MRSVEKKIYLALLVCFLVSGVGITFAYFAGSASGSGKGGSFNLPSADLIKVQYDAGASTLSLQNAMPGTTTSKDFSVKITPTNDEKKATYKISLAINSNTFVKCTNDNYNASTNACTKDAEELVYSLSEKNGAVLASGDLLGKTGTIDLVKLTKSVTAATTYQYTLSINYKNTGADQNHNVNKSLSGSVKVVLETE